MKEPVQFFKEKFKNWNLFSFIINISGSHMNKNQFHLYFYFWLHNNRRWIQQEVANLNPTMICARICGRLKPLLKYMHIVLMSSRDYKRMEVGEEYNNPFTILNICVQHCYWKNKRHMVTNHVTSALLNMCFLAKFHGPMDDYVPHVFYSKVYQMCSRIMEHV